MEERKGKMLPGFDFGNSIHKIFRLFKWTFFLAICDDIFGTLFANSSLSALLMLTGFVAPDFVVLAFLSLVLVSFFSADLDFVSAAIASLIKIGPLIKKAQQI